MIGDGDSLSYILHIARTIHTFDLFVQNLRVFHEDSPLHLREDVANHVDVLLYVG